MEIKTKIKEYFKRFWHHPDFDSAVKLSVAAAIAMLINNFLSDTAYTASEILMMFVYFCLFNAAIYVLSAILNAFDKKKFNANIIGIITSVITLSAAAIICYICGENEDSNVVRAIIYAILVYIILVLEIFSVIYHTALLIFKRIKSKRKEKSLNENK